MDTIKPYLQPKSDDDIIKYIKRSKHNMLKHCLRFASEKCIDVCFDMNLHLEYNTRDILDQLIQRNYKRGLDYVIETGFSVKNNITLTQTILTIKDQELGIGLIDAISDVINDTLRDIFTFNNNKYGDINIELIKHAIKKKKLTDSVVHNILKTAIHHNQIDFIIDDDVIFSSICEYKNTVRMLINKIIINNNIELLKRIEHKIDLRYYLNDVRTLSAYITDNKITDVIQYIITYLDNYILCTITASLIRMSAPEEQINYFYDRITDYTDSNDILLGTALMMHDMNKMMDLISKGANPSVNGNAITLWAYDNDNHDLLKFLLSDERVSSTITFKEKLKYHTFVNYSVNNDIVTFEPLQK